jgi:hypothetical protein
MPSVFLRYVRQVRACETLGQLEKAKDILARALRRPELNDDEALADMLISLYTNGEGLSDDEATFKQWTIDIMINNDVAGDRVHNIGGAWRKKIDAQFAKFRKN